MATDKERLDFLQMLLERKQYTGMCTLRESSTGRGWRLHETNSRERFSDVRTAIDTFMGDYDGDQ